MRFIFVKILTLSTENTEWLSKTVWVPRIFVRERDVFKLLHKFTNKWCIVGYDTEDVRFSNFAHRLAAPLRPVAKLTVSTWPCHQSLQSSNPCREWTTFFIIVCVVSYRYPWDDNLGLILSFFLIEKIDLRILKSYR
jgi:hypothetical protein